MLAALSTLGCLDRTGRLPRAPLAPGEVTQVHDTGDGAGSDDEVGTIDSDRGNRMEPADPPADTGPEPEPEDLVHGVLLAHAWERRDVPLGEGAGHYRFIVMQDYMYELLPGVREVNPDAVILGYQNVGGMRPDGGTRPSSGVQQAEADDGHESWYLHDADGNRMFFCDYPTVAAANVGDPTYQQRWLENARGRLLADGFDGVLMDDVNTFPGHCMGSLGTPLAEYETDEAYGDALVSFMHAVGPALKAEGLLVVPNVGMNPWNDEMHGRTVQVFPDVTHLFREFWMRWDDSANFTGDMWETTLDVMLDAEAAGVGFLGVTYGPGDEGVEAGQQYGRASWLLAWDGEAESGWGYMGDTLDPWSEGWTPDIGTPIEGRVTVGVGYQRRFSRGIVVVDPSADTAQTFALGETYVDPDGALVDTVTLRPGQAQVLSQP